MTEQELKEICSIKENRHKIYKLAKEYQQQDSKPYSMCWSIADVVCSCYMCGKSIDHPEEQYDMYGEKVCQDCWDYNMHQALQDGGGM